MNGHDPNDSKDEAVLEASECLHCNLSGLVTIYRPGYAGLPVAEQETASGKSYRARMRSAAYCFCPVGQWAKRCNPNDKITPQLADVFEGRLPWLTYDPTTPELPEEIALGNWRDAVAWMIARQPRLMLEKVKQATVQRAPDHAPQP